MHKGLLRAGRAVWLGPVSLIPMFALAQAAQAAPTTFAQVLESPANVNANVFAYLDNGAGNAEFGTDVAGVFGAKAAAEFTFLSVLGALPADLSGVQDATISMTSSTTVPATTIAGMFGDQPITGLGTVTDVVKITRDTPALEGAGTRTNLLTMTFTGHLLGAIGGTTPQLSGNSGLGDMVTYSSDFVSFAQSTQQDYSLTFSSWGPANPPPPGLSVASDGNFNAATAAGTGTFDFQGTANVIPEPGSLWLSIFGGFAISAGFRRRRALLA